MKRELSCGFSLIELMIVVAIIAILSIIAIPNLTKYLYKARRAEVYIHLGSLYTAQRAYWAEHGMYAKALTGPESLCWQPEGYQGGGKKERFYYTYGFGHGNEGIHYMTGKCGSSAQGLSMTRADKDGFVIGAIADIDGDGDPDIFIIDQRGVIEHIKDDLSLR